MTREQNQLIKKIKNLSPEDIARVQQFLQQLKSPELRVVPMELKAVAGGVPQPRRRRRRPEMHAHGRGARAGAAKRRARPRGRVTAGSAAGIGPPRGSGR